MSACARAAPRGARSATSRARQAARRRSSSFVERREPDDLAGGALGVFETPAARPSTGSPAEEPAAWQDPPPAIGAARGHAAGRAGPSGYVRRRRRALRGHRRRCAAGCCPRGSGRRHRTSASSATTCGTTSSHLERVPRRSSLAPRSEGQERADDPYWERYMRALFELSRLGADDVARLIGARDPKRLLDSSRGPSVRPWTDPAPWPCCRRIPSSSGHRSSDLEGAARIGARDRRSARHSERPSRLVGDHVRRSGSAPARRRRPRHSIVHHFDPQRMTSRARASAPGARRGRRRQAVRRVLRRSRERAARVGTSCGLLLLRHQRRAHVHGGGDRELVRGGRVLDVRSRHQPRLAGSALVLGRAGRAAGGASSPPGGGGRPRLRRRPRRARRGPRRSRRGA